MKTTFFAILAFFASIITFGQTDNRITIGTIDSIQSTILNEERKIWVYVPHNGTTNSILAAQKYPVVYLLDGNQHFSSVVGMIQQKAQNSLNNFRIGITTKIDKNLSSESMVFDQYTGYSADYDKINYRIGLNLEYQLEQNFSMNTAIQYSNKDFTGTYYCAVCDFPVPPSPEDIDNRFIEVPLSLRYYFLPDRFGLFGEVGINNQFLLNEELTDKSYALGIKLGAGFEYDFTQKLAFQFLVDCNRGITNLYNESNFKINYLGFGVGILKKI